MQIQQSSEFLGVSSYELKHLYSRISPANFPSYYIGQNGLDHSLAGEQDYHDWLKNALRIYSRIDYPNKIILLKGGKGRKNDKQGAF